MKDNIINLEDALHKSVRRVSEEANADNIYTIIDIRWYSNNRIHNDKNIDPIGIVLVEDTTCNTICAIIGNGTDPQKIAAWGSKVDRRMAEGIFGYNMPDYKVR